jgi:Sec-independent protein secretion pathway component TatC
MDIDQRRADGCAVLMIAAFMFWGGAIFGFIFGAGFGALR